MTSPKLLTRLAAPVAGMALVIAGWSASRGYVARGIAERAERQPATSRAALSELAQLGDSALPAMLDAAVSDDREVSQPARQQIEAMIERWAASSPGALDSRCLRVVRGVIAREPRLTPSGRVWARQLGDQVLRSLTRVRAASPDPRTIAAVEDLYDASWQTSQYPDQPLRPRDIRPVAIAKPSVPEVGALAPVVTPTPELPEPPLPPQPAPIAAAEQPIEQPLARKGPASSGAQAPDSQGAPPQEPTSRGPVATGPTDLPWRRPESAAQPGVPSREPPVLPLDEEPPLPLAEQALAPEVEELLQGGQADKLRLVEQLLAGRHENAATALLRLAKDPSPQVRVSALSALGTSPNRKLTEAAYQLAIHDEDPKVARIAGELQKLLR